MQESALQLGLLGLFGQEERVVEEGGRGVTVALQVAGFGEAEEVLLLHLRKNIVIARKEKKGWNEKQGYGNLAVVSSSQSRAVKTVSGHDSHYNSDHVYLIKSSCTFISSFKYKSIQ